MPKAASDAEKSTQRGPHASIPLPSSEDAREGDGRDALSIEDDLLLDVCVRPCMVCVCARERRGKGGAAKMGGFGRARWGAAAFHTDPKLEPPTLRAVFATSTLCKHACEHNKSCRACPTYQELACLHPFGADWVVFCGFCGCRLVIEKHGFSRRQVDLVGSSTDQKPRLVGNPCCPPRRGGHPRCGHAWMLETGSEAVPRRSVWVGSRLGGE